MVYIWFIYMVYIWRIYGYGWWLTYPSEKYGFVSWDDDIPNNFQYMGK